MRKCPQLTCKVAQCGSENAVLVSLQVKSLGCLLRLHKPFSGCHRRIFCAIDLAVQPRGTAWIQHWHFLANRLVSESRTCCEIPGQDWKHVFSGTVRLVAWLKRSSGGRWGCSLKSSARWAGRRFEGSVCPCLSRNSAGLEVGVLLVWAPARAYSSSVPCGAP